MKTWEMVKELTENPRKVFISNKGTDSEMIAQIKHGCLFIEDTLRGLTSVSLNREWEIETEIDAIANDFIDNEIYVSYEMLDIED